MALPVGATAIKKSAGTQPTVRYVPVGENLLSNGTFESNTTGWTLANGATLTRDTGTYKVGSASLKVARGSADTGATLTTKVTVHPGAQYALALWLHAATSSGASALIRWYDSASASISTSATTPSSSTLNGWAFVSATATAPPNAATADIELSVATANHCFFDAIEFRPCVPLVESAYTEPTSTGTFTAGTLTYNVQPGAHFLGDVKVFDMAAQTDMTLADSSYTRVYGKRHTFVGDVLLDNGVVRLWLKKGYSDSANIRASCYANGAWQTAFDVGIDTGGDTTGTLRSVTLSKVGRAEVVATLTDTDGNTAQLTLRRGAHGVKIKTTRSAAVGSNQDFQVTVGRFGAYDASTLLTDASISISGNVAGSSLTQPYTLSWSPTLPYLSAVVMAKKPSTQHIVISSSTVRVLWRDSAATTNAFERTFWLMLVPWPWAMNGYGFMEAESATTSGGSSVAAGDSSGGVKLDLDANGETVDYTLAATRDLPLGHYTMVIRAKDSNQVASDCTMSVYNSTDASSLASSAKTLTASYAFYTLDFELASASDGDSIRIRAAKSTATANTISIDYFLIVPRKRNSATPTHVFFPYDLARNALMDTTARESVRRL